MCQMRYITMPKFKPSCKDLENILFKQKQKLLILFYFDSKSCNTFIIHQIRMFRQTNSTMVFKSPNARTGPRVNFETPNLDESAISGRGMPVNRDSVNSRKKIAISHANSVAFGGGVRSTIATGQSVKQPVPANPLDFNPKKFVTKDLSEQDIIQLKQVFDFYDSEKAGMLSPNDLKVLLSSNGFNPTKETLYEIFSEMDEEELGGITFEYFLKMADPDRLKQEKKDTIRRIYRKYDKRNQGFITYAELRTVVLHELQEDINEELLQEIFKKADSNMDGKMTFEDFYNVVTKRVYQ